MRAAVRTAALQSVGAFLALIGLGFLTLALWLYLIEVTTMLEAASIIGALYAAVGFLLLAIASRRGGNRHDAQEADAPPPPSPAPPLVQLAEGFAMGLQAGRGVGRR